MLLYSMSLKDDNSTNSLFLLNKTFDTILPVGIKLNGWENSIVEGEYIEELRSFYAYDMI